MIVLPATHGSLLRLARAVRERPWAAAGAGALWCGASYWGFLGYLGLGDGASLVAVVITAVVIGVPAFLVPFRLLRPRPAGRAGMKIVVAAFTGIGLGFALMGRMESDALEVAEKGRPASMLLAMAGFQDQWVVLTDRDSGKALRGCVELLLLGEREGAYALYDCANRETFRISIDSTVLRQVTLEPDRPSGYTCAKRKS
ncbi:hypothetical protein OG320_28150 [Microbispora sp. NBC_01189]|uniref:hypothetical protein n=1 Tax=Microbispora sp. NBC_01189 TaxID=2903583 RepID=UPI002E122591|nr:hypothetical protein OG320_28150 [Microbispora sp. NBC_01189]